MKILISTIFIFINLTCFCQKNFQIRNECKKVTSNFNNVKIIDLRRNQSAFGYVKTGISNEQTPVEYEGIFIDDLKSSFSSSTKNKPLTIILKEFYFTEREDGGYEKGRLNFTADFFTKKNTNEYTLLLSLDTIFEAYSGIDVTKHTLELFEENICNTIELLNASKEKNKLYSSYLIQKLDSLKKENTPIYKIKNHESGTYKTFKDFKNNNLTPFKIEIDSSKSGKIVAYKVANNKRKKLRTDNIFACSDGNNLYRANSVGFYKIFYENGDFYYFGQTNFTNNQYSAAAWGVAFGLTGVLVATAINHSREKKNNQTFKFKINHNKGNSIPIGIINNHEPKTN